MTFVIVENISNHHEYCSHRKGPHMIALVFLQSFSLQSALCEILEKQAVFRHVYRADSAGHCLALAEKHPHSIGFYSVSPSSRNLASRYWLAVGSRDEEALLAFSHNASGFVKTPLEETQVLRAIECVKTKYYFDKRDFQFSTLIQGLCKQYGVSELALLANLRRQLYKNAPPCVIGLRTDNGWLCLNPDDIKWIEAAGDYMCVHTLSERYIVRTTLCDLLKRLEGRYFKRCSRSVAVNAKHVAHIKQKLSQQQVVMQSGEAFKITDKYYYQLWHEDRGEYELP